MTLIHHPIGARALSDLATSTPGPIRALAERLRMLAVAWRDRRARRATRALLRGLPRETARDIGLADWAGRRSAGAAGPPPRADRS